MLSISDFFLNQWIFGKVTRKKMVVSCTKCVRQPPSCFYLCHIFTGLIFFADRLINKPFLIWLLTSPPHLKYVATLPCNLSLVACFLALLFYKEVWEYMQGVVGPIITTLLLNLLENIPVKEFWKSVKIWQNCGHEFGMQFLAHPVDHCFADVSEPPF